MKNDTFKEIERNTMEHKTYSIIKAIRNGEHTELYEKWSHHEDSTVRYTLADKGYFPDTFIKDNNDEVRMVVLASHPEYIHHLLDDATLYQRVNLIIEKEKYPNVNVLTKHIENVKKFNSDFYIEDMEIKLKSLTHTPTPLELTMTSVQLYKANSPLWALHMTPEDINYFLEAPEAEKNDDKWLEYVLK